MRLDYSWEKTKCQQCNKGYIPSEGKHLVELKVPIILANNFCSRKCWGESLKSVADNKVNN